MKKTVKTKVMAAVLAAVTACSAGAMAVTAFAAEKHPGECGYNYYVNEYGKHPGESGYRYQEMSTLETKKSMKTFELEFDAYDWNYSAESTNAKITCEFDYAAKNAKFIVTGTKAGITKAVLKVKNAEGKWYNIPVTFTVSDDLNVSVKQVGDVFTTTK
ncbi:MAG: hypothetical protein II388_03725 [Clostridia bacterium]|nr:hypothetical protein [Clostridia bacterium]